jgi:hypothetical protein
MTKPPGITHQPPQLHEAVLACVIGLAALGANAALAFWTVGSVVRTEKRLVQTSELSAAVSQAVAVEVGSCGGVLRVGTHNGPYSEGFQALVIGSYGTTAALSRASVKLPGDLRAKIMRIQEDLRALERTENGSPSPPARAPAKGDERPTLQDLRAVSDEALEGLAWLHASQAADARWALGQAYAGLGITVALDAFFILWWAVRGVLRGPDPAGRFGASPCG